MNEKYCNTDRCEMKLMSCRSHKLETEISIETARINKPLCKVLTSNTITKYHFCYKTFFVSSYKPAEKSNQYLSDDIKGLLFDV